MLLVSRRTGIEMGENTKKKEIANNRKKFTSLIVLMKLNERVENGVDTCSDDAICGERASKSKLFFLYLVVWINFKHGLAHFVEFGINFI